MQLSYIDHEDVRDNVDVMPFRQLFRDVGCAVGDDRDVTHVIRWR